MPFDSTPVEVPVAPRTKEAVILDGAIGLIETHGWIQGEYANLHGFCVIGAIRQSALNEASGWLPTSPFSAYARVLSRVQATTPVPTYTWNDAKGRTKADVVALLRRVRSEF